MDLRKISELAAAACAACVLGLQVLVILGREILPNLPDLSLADALTRSRLEDLARMPPQGPFRPLTEVEMVRKVRASTPPDGLYLLFHQNTFAYYADRLSIRDVDTRLVPFYRAVDRDAALAELRRLGIRYVYLPPWKWPTIQGSQILAIVADPALAELAVEHAGYRLYRLRW